MGDFMVPFLRGFESLQISYPELLHEAPSTAQTAEPSHNKQKKKKKKKKKKRNPAPPPSDQALAPSTSTAGPDDKSNRETIVHRFDEYFGSGDLADWQRLCRDVGLEGEYPSKTQCKKALKTVHVNIYDLLDAVNAGKPVKRFANQKVLAQYTKETRRIYPKEEAKESGPVRALLRIVFR